MSGAKEVALKLVDSLPDGASWEDLIYQMYVRKKIEGVIEAADQRPVVAHEDVRKLFLSE